MLSLSVYPFAWSVLSNKVWGLEGCRTFLPLRTNRYVRFGFGGLTVQSASSGDQVSFNTTVGVWGCPFDGNSTKALDLGLLLSY